MLVPPVVAPEVGCERVLTGLKSRPELNGEHVEITGVLSTGKFKVVLTRPTLGNKEYAVGLANLASADTEPPAGADGGERVLLNPSDVSRCPAALALVGLRLCSAKSFAGERSALASARRCASAGFPHLG